MADLPPDHQDPTTNSEDASAEDTDPEIVADNEGPTISDFGMEVYSVLLEAKRAEQGVRFFCEDCKTVNYRLYVNLTDCHTYPCKEGVDTVCDYAKKVALYLKNGPTNINIRPLVGVTCVPPHTRPGVLILIQKDDLRVTSFHFTWRFQFPNANPTDAKGIYRLESMDCIDLRSQCSDPDILTVFLKHVKICRSTYDLIGTCSVLDQNAISLGIQRLGGDPIHILHWHVKAYLWASEVLSDSFKLCHLSCAVNLVDILYFQPIPPQDFQYSETAFSITNRDYLLNSIELVYQQTTNRRDGMRKLLAFAYAHFIRMYGFDTVPTLRIKAMGLIDQFPDLGADVMQGGFVLSADRFWNAAKLKQRVLSASYFTRGMN